MSPSRVSICAVLGWFFLLAFFLAFGSSAAWASAPQISDEASCMALLPGATWSDTTCTLTSPTSITSDIAVAPGVALTISSDLTIAPGATLQNFGSFTNFATIVVDGALVNTAANSGTAVMVNASLIVVNGGLSNACFQDPGGFGDCEFKNNGTILVSVGGHLANSCGQFLACNFSNNGSLDNAGTFTDECSATDRCSSVGVSNDGHVHNAATGTIEILWGAFFDNGGLFTGGTLDNDGQIQIADLPGSPLISAGFNHFGNFGTLNNRGLILVGANFGNAPLSLITNYGTITESPGAIGYLSNSGQIVENCGAVLTLVVYSGVPVDNACFDSTSTAISADATAIAPSSTTPITLTVTVSDTTTAYAFPPGDGTILFRDYGAGGYFQVAGPGGDPCDLVSPSTFNCSTSLTPVSGIASQLQVVYLPAPAAFGVNLTPGSTITLGVSYAGDNFHGSSNASTTVAVNYLPAPRFTSASSATFGVRSPNSFTVTAAGTPAPTLLRTGTLPSGVTFNTTTGVLAGTPSVGTVGTYTITFTARNGVPPDATQTFTLNVIKSNQSITFGALPDVSFGIPHFALTATASSSLTVTFSSSTPAVCTVTGKIVTLVAAGTCTIAADQAGNVNYNQAPEVTQSFAVAIEATTVTSISASQEPSVTGQPYNVTVSVTSSTGVPKGSVTVSDGFGGTCTDLALSSTGVALCSMTSTRAGPLTLTAAYSGSPGYAPSGATAPHVVTPATTKAAVSSSAEPALIGSSVTLAVKVTAVLPGKGIPTGTVQFLSGSTVLATGTLNASGSASFSTSSLPVGLTPVVANYLGDGNYLATSSAAFNQSIAALPVLQFSVAAISVDETAGTVTLTVLHAGSALGSASVTYVSTDGTAVAPGDYAATSGTLTWAAGDLASKSIAIPIVLHAGPVSARTFAVTLSSPVGATLGSRTTETITIKAHP